jgi:hypothetical protein
VEEPEYAQTTAQTQNDFSGREIRSNQVNVACVPEESDWSGEVHLGYIPGRTEKMSHAINLPIYSDDNREGSSTNAASVPLLSRKRHRDKEASSNDAHLRNGDGPVDTTATSTETFIVDLELEDEVEVSVPPKKNRRGARRSKRSEKNDAAESCVESLKGVHATENDVDSEDVEDVQVVDHCESHKGIAATIAVSHPMSLDSDHTNPNDESTNDYSQKLSTSEPPSNASGRQSNASVWEGRLSELADYRKFHGHCNVPQRCSESAKLACWVANQRKQYKLHQEGKTSPMTNLRIQALESLDFEWRVFKVSHWKVRLSELADYRKLHGHSNVPASYSKNNKLASWVGHQKSQYKLHQGGKTSSMTPSRVQALESLGFKWDSNGSAWEVRLSELAEYHRINGHCNVPYNYSENANWLIGLRTKGASTSCT